MRGAPYSMEVLRPGSVEEAVTAYGRRPEAIPLAGGTDFMVAWNTGSENGKTILDLSALGDWKHIRKRSTSLRIGALASHWQVQTTIRRVTPFLMGQTGSRYFTTSIGLR